MALLLLLFIVDFRIGMRIIGGEFPSNVSIGTLVAEINGDIPINCSK
jgi:hypothetical protein